MSENPIHCLLLKGYECSLSNCILTYKLPRKDFFQGIWQIAIGNVSYTLKDVLSEFVVIKSNFVTDIGYNKNNEIEPFQSQLAFCLFKGNGNEKKILNIDKNWFLINAISDTLIITLIFDTKNEATLKKKLMCL